MSKRGRKIPAGEDRGPRDRKVTIYLTAEEEEVLSRVADNFSFRSKSALVAFLLEPLCRSDFTGISFNRLRDRFLDLPGKRKGKFAWKQLPFIHKTTFPDVETVNREQEEKE